MNIACGLRALAPVAKRASQILKCKAPTILVATGITSGVTAAVMAVKRTPLVQAAKADCAKWLKVADDCLEKGTITDYATGEEIAYTPDIHKVDCTGILGQKYLETLKAYAPSVVLGVFSITCILAGHHIMMMRNAALTAAVSSVAEAFRKYRNNVRAEYGDEVDYNMRHGLVCSKEKVKEIDPETGKLKSTTKTVVKQRDGDAPWRSDYARCFAEGCRNFTRDPSANQVTVKAWEEWCNQRLRTNGYLFLNEVYNLMGLDGTLAGSEMGWIYVNEGDNEYGDNYVDFGFRSDSRFMNCEEAAVWLDFNVDDIPIRERIKWAVK